MNELQSKLAALTSGRAYRTCWRQLKTLPSLMAPHAPTSAKAMSGGTAVEEQPARRPRGKRANMSVETLVADTPSVAEAVASAYSGAPSGSDSEAPGRSKVQRLNRRRVTARRPRAAAADALAAADPAERAETGDDSNDAAEPGADLAQKAQGVMGATRGREQELWARGFARVAGARARFASQAAALRRAVSLRMFGKFVAADQFRVRLCECIRVIQLDIRVNCPVTR